MHTTITVVPAAVPSVNAEKGYYIEAVSTQLRWSLPTSSVHLPEVEVTLDLGEHLNERNLLESAIKTLRDRQTHAMAEAAALQASLQKEIDALLAITYQPSED